MYFCQQANEMRTFHLLEAANFSNCIIHFIPYLLVLFLANSFHFNSICFIEFVWIYMIRMCGSFFTYFMWYCVVNMHEIEMCVRMHKVEEYLFAFANQSGK